MLTTILVAMGLLVDIGLGGRALGHAKSIDKKLDILDERLTKLEKAVH